VTEHNTDKSSKAIEREAIIAEYEQERRRSMIHLEAAICSLMHTASPHEAARILRQQADIVEAYE
jgi:hypothetical protein